MRILRLALFSSAVALLASASPLAAEASTGRVVGRVLDARDGQPIPSAQVVVTGTQIGALASVDGRFVLTNVPAGVQSITVMSLGFATKTVQGVQVTAG